MGIFAELIEAVQDGHSFRIDLQNRSLKVGKKYWVKNGVIAEGKELDDIIINTWDEGMFPILEELYLQYKYSLPSERSESKYRKYFKALPMEELSDEAMVTGEERELARARLEGFLLMLILHGWEWKDVYGAWFWQSKRDSDLIILRSWIDGNASFGS